MAANVGPKVTHYSPGVYRAMQVAYRFLRQYHRYEAFGVENIPQQGGALVLFHHSLATYDNFLLAMKTVEVTGRQFIGIADRLAFRIPVFAQVITELGFTSMTRAELVETVKGGELVGLAPGGTRDMLRPSREKYRFDWHDRTGFAWVAIMAEAPILLAACPAADDLFEVIDNPLTSFVYERWRAPLPIFRGRLGLPVPHAVTLRHLVSEPMHPPVKPADATPAIVERWHLDIIDRMTRLMAEARALGPE